MYQPVVSRVYRQQRGVHHGRACFVAWLVARARLSEVDCVTVRPRVEVVELTEAPAVRGDEMAEATAETLRTLTRPPSRVAQPARMIFLYSCGGARRNGKSHVRALGSGGGRTRTSNVTTPSSDMSAQPIISSTRSSMSTSIVTVLLAAQRSACFSSRASRWPLPSRSSLANAS